MVGEERVNMRKGLVRLFFQSQICAHIVYLNMLTQNRSISRSQGSAYREFSRRRYKQLKGQLTNLRESEIVARVIREWDAMNNDQKNRYLDMKGETMVMLNVEPLATPHKDDIMKTKGKTNQKTTGAKKMENSEVKEGSEEDVFVADFALSEEQMGMKKSSSNEIMGKPMKMKQIAKPKSNKSNDYINFFKNYFQHLTKEHPKWSAKQITSIIKLLWKKRKSNEGKPSRSVRLAKPMSGYKTFLRENKMMGQTYFDSCKRWKVLPRESRLMWSKKGNPANFKSEKSPLSMRTTMKFSGENAPMMTQFRYLDMKMM